MFRFRIFRWTPMRWLKTDSTNVPTFLDPVNPYINRTTISLINSMFVLMLCQIPPLVKHGSIILSISEKLRLDPIIHACIKKTFFQQFCGGETLEELRPTIQNFHKYGIGSIIDLALEADVSNHEMMSVEAGIAARNVCKLFNGGVELANEIGKCSIAIKMSAIFPPSLLERWSTTLIELNQAFDRLPKVNHNGCIDYSAFTQLGEQFPLLAPEAKYTFNAADRDSDHFVDWIDMLDIFSPCHPQFLSLLIKPTGITEMDIRTLKRIWPHLMTLAEKSRVGTRLLVDAEQTYLQPAIDAITLSLSSRYNRTVYAPIFNTYQMYLKDAYSRLMQDIKRSKRNNYSLGIKLVRGAYMQLEDKRASRLGYSSPIQDSIDETHKAYNQSITFLSHMILSDHKTLKPNVMVATHNEDSICHTLSCFPKSILTKTEFVSFAQLMGMQDHTSHALGASNYAVYKYIPYGPVQITIPYLQRRAIENEGILEGNDINLIWRELKSRLFKNIFV
jgi:proline dehydrogenase